MQIKFEIGFNSVNGIVKRVYALHDFPNIKERCDVWDVLPIVYTRQFTGLNDKDGKNIFEGDIYEVAGNKKYIVKYCTGAESNHEWFGGAFVLFLSESVFFPFDEFAMKNGRVIGNIYENKDLIK